MEDGVHLADRRYRQRLPLCATPISELLVEAVKLVDPEAGEGNLADKGHEVGLDDPGVAPRRRR